MGVAVDFEKALSHYPLLKKPGVSGIQRRACPHWDHTVKKFFPIAPFIGMVKGQNELGQQSETVLRQIAQLSSVTRAGHSPKGAT